MTHNLETKQSKQGNLYRRIKLLKILTDEDLHGLGYKSTDLDLIRLNLLVGQINQKIHPESIERLNRASNKVTGEDKFFPTFIYNSGQ
jgi:hypothetical protein